MTLNQYAVDLASGLVSGARYAPSPNADDRPCDDIQALIVHAISLPPESFGGDNIEAFFCNTLDCNAHPYFQTIADMKVSAHFLIQRDGHTVQFVPTHKRAWHAGQSHFLGRSRVNDFSIGIELEGADTAPFDEAQYAALGALTRALMIAYPSITTDHIAGHSDIAPGRKTDPGPFFDWPAFRSRLSCTST